MIQSIKPKDHAEEVALFRAQILGPVLRRELARGELLAELRVLAELRFRPPGSAITKTYALPTLLRWRRAYLKDGLAGLRPKSRRIGDALALAEEERELLLEIRRQFPSVPANVILDTLALDSRLAKGTISAQTLRRLYRGHGMARVVRSKANRPTGERRRWEAEHAGQFWHADVCHGKSLLINGKRVPVRIHAILDDKSRYIVALRVTDNEREVVMLDLMLQSLHSFGAPKTLYLDNGSTYRGCALETACGRLGIQLLHASPYDPQARGKMERFWRTMRQGCLDHLTNVSSLHDVQVRLTAFLVERYHKSSHAGLMGSSPAQAWGKRKLCFHTDEQLEEALTVREARRVRHDCTLSIGNIDWEVREAFLAGKLVTVCRSLANPQHEPWIEQSEERFDLVPVSPVANGLLRKRRKRKPGIDAVDFDPPGVLLERMLRRNPRHKRGN